MVTYGHGAPGTEISASCSSSLLLCVALVPRSAPISTFLVFNKHGRASQQEKALPCDICVAVVLVLFKYSIP